MHLIKLLSLFTTILLLSGCLEDLNPESKDKRTAADLAPSVSQDFTATTTLNEIINLEQELLTYDALVLYFTMWCPLCDSHMNHMRSQLIKAYPNARFLMVDYVSGSISQSYSSQLANGHGDLTLISDYQQTLLHLYDATMASVIVINDQKSILLNEDYKNGARLIETLENL